MDYKKLIKITDSLEGDKLFHVVSHNQPEVLKDILTYGLRANDNGERNGVWFNYKEPFYKNTHNQFILSLPHTDEVRDAYGFDSYEWENSSGILVAHKDVPISALTIERGFFCQIFYMGMSRGFLDGEPDNRFDDITYEDCASWTKDFNYVLYKDLYEAIYKKSLPEGLENLPNIKLDIYCK